MGPEHLSLLIPIIAIVMGIGLAMINSVGAHRRRSQALEQRHRERMAAIEKGLELPPEATDPEAQLELARDLRTPRYLLRGLVLTGVGAVLLLTWQGPAEEIISSAGWIVTAIGVATLVYYFIEGRKEKPLSLPPLPGDEPRR